jgi:hypothetical protein
MMIEKLGRNSIINDPEAGEDPDGPERLERTRNEFRGKVARDDGFWVLGTLRPWENPGNICAMFQWFATSGGSPWTPSRSR